MSDSLPLLLRAARGGCRASPGVDDAPGRPVHEIYRDLRDKYPSFRERSRTLISPMRSRCSFQLLQA